MLLATILALVAPSVSFADTITYFNNGTFIAPVGITTVWINMSGGGGGGGGGGYYSISGGGGGGSAAVSDQPVAVTPGASYQIIVGAGGSPGQGGFYYGSPGGVGGTSSFGTLLTTRGGAGGGAGGGNYNVYSTAIGGAAGGVGGTDGTGGNTVWNAYCSPKGAGGSSLFGVGGSSMGACATDGNVGSGYGAGGGGGGGSFALAVPHPGAPGTNGIVQIYIPPPPTVSLTASPNPVTSGGRPTLTWSSTGATSCVAGGPWSNSGTLSGGGLTNPLYSNTTFTLQCTGPGGTSPLQSVTVGVTAAPCSLPWGGTTNDGSSVTAYQSSSVTSPSTCVSQTRMCTNGTLSGSYAYQSCSVTSAAPTASLTADPSILYGVGKTTSLSWFSTNATSCTGTGFSTGGAVTGTTSVTLDTLGSTTFTVTCSGSGGSASDSKVVTVSGQPSITVAPVGPPLVQLGSTITANWSVVNMKSNTCHMTGTGGSDQAITNATNSSGTVTTPPITVASTFTISCTGLDGTAYSSSFNVGLVPQTMEI